MYARLEANAPLIRSKAVRLSSTTHVEISSTIRTSWLIAIVLHPSTLPHT